MVRRFTIFYQDDRPSGHFEGSTGSSDKDEPQPIGVPSGYTSRKRKVGTGTKIDLFGGGRITLPIGEETIRARVRPRYFEGEELAITGMSPQQVAKWQRRMRDAGILTKINHLGRADDATIEAFAIVLGMANRMGLDKEAALNKLIKSHKDAKRKGFLDEKGAPKREKLPPLELDNPDKIRAMVNSASFDIIGRQLQPHEMELFVNAWHTMQRDSYNQLIGISKSGLGEGDEFVGPYEPGDETAEAILRYIAPSDFNSKRFADNMASLGEAIAEPRI